MLTSAFFACDLRSMGLREGWAAAATARANRPSSHDRDRRQVCVAKVVGACVVSCARIMTDDVPSRVATPTRWPAVHARSILRAIVLTVLAVIAMKRTRSSTAMAANESMLLELVRNQMLFGNVEFLRLRVAGEFNNLKAVAKCWMDGIEPIGRRHEQHLR